MKATPGKKGKKIAEKTVVIKKISAVVKPPVGTSPKSVPLVKPEHKSPRDDPTKNKVGKSNNGWGQ